MNFFCFVLFLLSNFFKYLYSSRSGSSSSCQIKTLDEQRKKREENWSYFLEELSKERDREDVQHANEIKEIDDQFAKLDETLVTSAPWDTSMEENGIYFITSWEKYFLDEIQWYFMQGSTLIFRMEAGMKFEGSVWMTSCWYIETVGV